MVEIFVVGLYVIFVLVVVVVWVGYEYEIV